MSLLTRYLTQLIVTRFVLLLFGMGAFLLGLDLMANANAVMAHENGGVAALVRYAVLRSPTFVSDLIKIATLLAGLMTFKFLIGHGELTAIWSSGVSQFGLMGRLIPLAIALGSLQFVVDNQIFPASVDKLREWGVAYNTGKVRDQDTGEVTWIHLGNDIARIPSANITARNLHDFTLFKRDARGKLLARLNVGSARYSDGSWQLFDITIMRTSTSEGAPLHEATRDWPIDLNATDLRLLLVHPRHLSLNQTRRLINTNGQGIWGPHIYQTWLYAKLANCLAPFLMLCLCVVLAQQSQRVGHTQFLLLGGVAIGFSFFIFNGVTLAMGEAGLLPPLIASGHPLVVLAAITASVAYWHKLKPRPAQHDSDNIESKLP